jgi:hypothetical protein
MMRDLRTSLAALEAVALLLERLAMMHPCWACGRAATVRGKTKGKRWLACDSHVFDGAEVDDLKSAEAVRAGVAVLSTGGDA